MTAVISEISAFDNFLNIVISDLWVICKYEYCILNCSLVDLKDLWKFEVESKFRQNLKIFMTLATLAKFQILTTFWTM